MTQQNSDENKDLNNDLKDIIDALNENETIIDPPSDYQSDDDMSGVMDGSEAADILNFGDEADAHAVLEKLMAENEALKEQVEALKADNLRTVADMQNLRKRTQREIADAKTFSVSSFAKDMLGVADNLKRTLDAAKTADDADDNQPADNLKTLLEGVDMTERSMLSTMERHGVKKLDVLNQKFDPNFHQAMFEVPDTQTPNNTVVQVVQDGYIIGERVLRPAMVGVAKGGPKAVDAQNAGADGTSDDGNA